MEYQDSPWLYHAELMTETEFEQEFAQMRQDNAWCQAEASQKLLVPKPIILQLTDIITKGKGLP